MTEVRGFGAPRMAVDEFGVSRDDQERGQTRRDDVGLSDVKALQIELAELAGRGRSDQPDTESELRCMVFNRFFVLHRVNASEKQDCCPFSLGRSPRGFPLVGGFRCGHRAAGQMNSAAARSHDAEPRLMRADNGQPSAARLEKSHA